MEHNKHNQHFPMSRTFGERCLVHGEEWVGGELKTKNESLSYKPSPLLLLSGLMRSLDQKGLPFDSNVAFGPRTYVPFLFRFLY